MYASGPVAAILLRLDPVVGDTAILGLLHGGAGAATASPSSLAWRCARPGSIAVPIAVASAHRPRPASRISTAASCRVRSAMPRRSRLRMPPGTSRERPGGARRPTRRRPGDGLYLGRAQITPALRRLVRARRGRAPRHRRARRGPLLRDASADRRGGAGEQRLPPRGLSRPASAAARPSTSSSPRRRTSRDLSLELPLGAIGEITAAEHFAHGLLETTEVDPGREYFFRLGRFTRHRHSLDLRLLPGGRADATVGGSLDVVRVDDRAAFFDHEQQARLRADSDTR